MKQQQSGNTIILVLMAVLAIAFIFYVKEGGFTIGGISFSTLGGPSASSVASISVARIVQEGNNLTVFGEAAVNSPSTAAGENDLVLGYAAGMILVDGVPKAYCAGPGDGLAGSEGLWRVDRRGGDFLNCHVSFDANSFSVGMHTFQYVIKMSPLTSDGMFSVTNLQPVISVNSCSGVVECPYPYTVVGGLKYPLSNQKTQSCYFRSVSSTAPVCAAQPTSTEAFMLAYWNYLQPETWGASQGTVAGGKTFSSAPTSYVIARNLSAADCAGGSIVGNKCYVSVNGTLLLQNQTVYQTIYQNQTVYQPVPGPIDYTSPEFLVGAVAALVVGILLARMLR